MSSQFIFVLSYLAHFQCGFGYFLIKRLIFMQIDFISYIYGWIGSSQPFLVISQFSQFCVITAHISAERHLSKILYENFNSPLPPLTFKTIIIFHVKPFFTSAQGSTVKVYMDLWLKYLQIRLTINIVKITDRRSIFNSCEYVELKWSKGRFLKPSSRNFPISPLISEKFERIPSTFYWICKFFGIIILHQS